MEADSIKPTPMEEADIRLKVYHPSMIILLFLRYHQLLTMDRKAIKQSSISDVINYPFEVSSALVNAVTMKQDAFKYGHSRW